MWYQDTNTLSAIGSLGAVIMSVVALIASYRGQAAQQLREKREELRGILDRLISLREEMTEVNKLKDETEKTISSGYLNIKRSFYLEAAESIASQIPKKITASEYYVIGYENFLESDYLQAREYYRLAAKSSIKFSSLTKQSEIWRSLAGTYFLQDKALLDIDEGRKFFEKALQVLKGRNDHYSCYVRSLSYRDWASVELSCKNYSKTGHLLNEQYREWSSIPLWSGLYRGYEFRNLANLWRMLGAGYFQEAVFSDTQHIDDGRKAFKKSLEIIHIILNEFGIKDDYVIETYAMTYQEWGQQEMNAGFKNDAMAYFQSAKETYMSLSEMFVWKSIRLKEIDSLLASIAR